MFCYITHSCQGLKTHPLPVPCQSCWGDPALGPEEGTGALRGLCWFVPCDPSSPAATKPLWWPQQPHLCPAGGRMWSAALTTAQLPLSIQDSKRNLRLWMCRAPAGRNLWSKCKAPESPCQPGERIQGDKGFPNPSPTARFPSWGTEEDNPALGDVWGLSVHTALRSGPNGGLKGFQMCQSDKNLSGGGRRWRIESRLQNKFTTFSVVQMQLILCRTITKTFLQKLFPTSALFKVTIKGCWMFCSCCFS